MMDRDGDFIRAVKAMPGFDNPLESEPGMAEAVNQTCNLCHGTGRIGADNWFNVCHVCHGTGNRPKSKPIGAYATADPMHGIKVKPPMPVASDTVCDWKPKDEPTFESILAARGGKGFTPREMELLLEIHRQEHATPVVPPKPPEPEPPLELPKRLIMFD